ncbi:MAG: NAD(P)/FAD-dependent oxidoreductase, partial [Parvularcula sp.]
MNETDVAIIGAGPAGLMAAERLTELGYVPHLFDAMPAPARKFLMAGKSGLNISKAEPPELFQSRYPDAAPPLLNALTHFDRRAV